MLMKQNCLQVKIYIIIIFRYNEKWGNHPRDGNISKPVSQTGSSNIKSIINKITGLFWLPLGAKWGFLPANMSVLNGDLLNTRHSGPFDASRFIRKVKTTTRLAQGNSSALRLLPRFLQECLQNTLNHPRLP